MVHPIGTSPMHGKNNPLQYKNSYFLGVAAWQGRPPMAPLDSHDGFDAAPPFQVEPIRLQALIFKDMPSYSRPMKIHVPNKSMFASIFAGHTSGGGVFGRNLGGQKSNGIYKSSVVLLPAAYEPRMGIVPTKWSKQMSNWFGVFRTSQF